MGRRSITPEPVQLDIGRYELRRGGRRIPLERLPMELLIVLAQSQGRLVTREEIIERLWGKNPSLDPDRNLNTAVGKIRRALGDLAERPRFVETVVGKGYRFLAGPNGDNHPFELIGPQPQTGHAKATPLVVSAGNDTFEPQTLKSTPPSRHFHWAWLALASLSGIAAAFLWMYLRSDRVPKLMSYDQITRDGTNKVFRIGEIPLPIVADTARIYFTMPGTTRALEIGQVASTGGQASVLKTPLESPAALDVSPDGSEMLVASPAGVPDAPVWVLPLPNGPPHRLADIRAQSANWSSDEQRIVYAAASGLYSARKDGNDIRLLVPIDPSSGKQVYWPRWSPDRSTIRYSLYDPKTGYHSLWEVSGFGGPPRALLPGWNAARNDCCGSWTRDGNYYVFASTQSGRSDIWALTEGNSLLDGGGKPFHVTAGPIEFCAPLPARNGQLFAMGVESRGELVRYDSRSGALVPQLPGIFAAGVDYSRDGRQLTFVSQVDGTLWRSRSDGSERLQLMLPPMRVSLPRWSPDGRRIAFHARSPGQPYRIYVISASGGKPERILSGGNHEIDPNWSPDGRYLVFERAPWQERGGGRPTQIEIVEVATHQTTVVPGSEGLVSPRWSPDGRYIAAMTADSGALMLFDTPTQVWKELMRMHIGYPNWSRDSKHIYFDRFQPPLGVARVRIADGSVEDVFTPPPGQPIWTFDSWTGLDAEDSVLLLRDASIQEIYGLNWEGSR